MEPLRGPSEEQMHLLPPLLWPVPVLEALNTLGGQPAQLPGSRVIVGDPDEPWQGHWLYEQRAATQPHTRHGATCVGVLSESDWYRRERDHTPQETTERRILHRRQGQQ